MPHRLEHQPVHTAIRAATTGRVLVGMQVPRQEMREFSRFWTCRYNVRGRKPQYGVACCRVDLVIGFFPNTRDDSPA